MPTRLLPHRRFPPPSVRINLRKELNVTGYERCMTARRPRGEDEAKELTWRGRTLEAGDGRVVDEWGVVWGIAAFGIPYPLTGPIRAADDLRRYQPPDPEADYR